MPPYKASRAPAVSVGYQRLAVPAIDSALFVVWSERGLCHVHWLQDTAPLPIAELAPAAIERALPEPYASAFADYFAGRTVELAQLPIDPVGTAFQLSVWAALCDIPRGHVRSYASIAQAIGNPRAMRAVGLANGSNPLAVVVPCHRVIAKSGQLGGYSSGLARKRFLLALEGVEVHGDDVSAGQLPLL
jgi:methylated-DNA-[protein]-cysteine S-methyltransferase